MDSSQIDYSLYLVTDRALSRGRRTFEIVKAAVQGGVTCVQLREKDCNTREFIDQALAVKDFLKTSGIPLVINDRLDVAQAVGADGIHLGQSDMPFSMAKAIVGNSMFIGISAESVDDAIQAEKEGADYIGVSPIYKTPTKTDTAPPIGLTGLREIRKAVNIPLVGIGGLNVSNVYDVIKNGGDGVAIVSAIVSADDPEESSRALKSIIDRAKKL